jgi:transposase
MVALEPRVVDAVWEAVQRYIPERGEVFHPLGCHRRRIGDRKVFEAVLFRLVTGCSWDVAGRLGMGGETTLRTRYNQWNADGVFDRVVEEALWGYDRIVGIDLSDASVDASTHKAPCGGEGAGKSPVDRGKSGWKWSLVADRNGIPVGWAAGGANRNDCTLLAPTLADADQRGLLLDVETLHLDRGYAGNPARRTCSEYGIDDIVRTPKRPPGTARGQPKADPLGMRWTIERTNSWLSNFGQLRRNTDRNTKARLGQLALAIALIITIKLFKWADRWNPT